MHNNYFEFKHFKVHQDKCAMKVGTDGVLLGAWVRARGPLRILDIGTGTGLIALMLAQKTTGLIDAVELDQDAYNQASENFSASKWSDRIKCYYQSIQEYTQGCEVKYDLVVSNPPFFNSGTQSSDIKRANARHESKLTIAELVEMAASLLSEKGNFAIILPFELRKTLITQMSINGLWLLREARIRPLPDEGYVRIMFELGRQMPGECLLEEIVIEEGARHNYSKSFINYTKDFYLDK
jgi:tRNA1Val (adenine37-N6)-methyltransferase